MTLTVRHTIWEQELNEWRSGKRRIVWRVRWFNGNHKTPWDYDHATKSLALRNVRHLRSLSGSSATKNAKVKLYRVTVRSKLSMAEQALRRRDP